jgi:uncharacterized membrane protein (UPF0127 family)
MKYLSLLLLLFLVLAGCTFQIKQVCITDKCYAVEIAGTPAERAKGLMYRDQLDADKGMLFVFDKEGSYPFWMKNTQIPLDIIWINSSKEVVYVSRNSTPCANECPLISPGKDASYVLELNPGSDVQVGDKVNFY